MVHVQLEGGPPPGRRFLPLLLQGGFSRRWGGPVTSSPRALLNHSLALGKALWSLLDCPGN